LDANGSHAPIISDYSNLKQSTSHLLIFEGGKDVAWAQQSIQSIQNYCKSKGLKNAERLAANIGVNLSSWNIINSAQTRYLIQLLDISVLTTDIDRYKNIPQIEVRLKEFSPNDSFANYQLKLLAEIKKEKSTVNLTRLLDQFKSKVEAYSNGTCEMKERVRGIGVTQYYLNNFDLLTPGGFVTTGYIHQEICRKKDGAESAILDAYAPKGELSSLPKDLIKSTICYYETVAASCDAALKGSKVLSLRAWDENIFKQDLAKYNSTNTKGPQFSDTNTHKALESLKTNEQASITSKTGETYIIRVSFAPVKDATGTHAERVYDIYQRATDSDAIKLYAGLRDNAQEKIGEMEKLLSNPSQKNNERALRSLINFRDRNYDPAMQKIAEEKQWLAGYADAETLLGKSGVFLQRHSATAEIFLAIGLSALYPPVGALYFGAMGGRSVVDGVRAEDPSQVIFGLAMMAGFSGSRYVSQLSHAYINASIGVGTVAVLQSGAGTAITSSDWTEIGTNIYFLGGYAKSLKQMKATGKPALDLKQTPIRKTIKKEPKQEEKTESKTKKQPEPRQEPEKIVQTEISDPSKSNLERAAEISRKAFETEDITEKNNLLIQAENIYLKYGNFDKAGSMYYRAANIMGDRAAGNASEQAYRSKAMECYSKAGENCEKTGDFEKAGDMYFKAAGNTPDPAQKQAYRSKAMECYSKAEENCIKSGNFKGAGYIYSKAAGNTSDPEQKLAFYSKAEENYEKSGDFEKAGGMYLYAADNTFDQAQKQAYRSKAMECYSKAEENYGKSGNFEEAGRMYSKVAANTSDQAQGQAFFSKAGENYEKSGNFKRAGYMYSEAADNTSDPAQKSICESKAVGCYSKSGENYEKSGNFEEAGGMYGRAAELTSDPAQKQAYNSKASECYSKSGENYEKSGNFEEAGGMYGRAAELTSDPAQKLAFYSKAEEDYGKSEKFKEAGLMYYRVAYNTSDPAQKQAFYSKAEENYGKAGDFKKAGDMYFNAADNASDPAQKQTYKSKTMDCYSKAEENYGKFGNFEEAGNMYSKAAASTADPAQMQAFFSKAGENYKKSGNFNKAGDMYSSAAHRTVDQAQHQVYHSKASECYSKAGENYEKSGNFKEAGYIYSKAADKASDPAQRQAFYLKAEENYGKSGTYKKAGDMYREAAKLTADPAQKQAYESKSKTCFGFANTIEANPNEKEFLISLASRFNEPSTKDVLGKIPIRYMQLFIDGALGKKDAISKLKESQLPEAFNRIVNRIKTESNEFERQLSNGEKIDAKYAKYLLCTISDIETSNFAQSVNGVAEKLGLEKRPITPAFFEELYKAANEKLKPVFELQTKNVKKEFLVNEIELSLTHDDAAKLHAGLAKAKDGAADVAGIKKTYGSVADVFTIENAGARKEKVIGLMREKGVKEKTIESYSNGKIEEKNAMQMLVAQVDFGDLSPLVWAGIKGGMEQRYPGSLGLFEKFAQNGIEGMTPEETNTLILRLKELVGKRDEPGIMEDWLQSAGLGELMPKLRKCDAYQSIINAMEKIRTQEAGVGKNTREMSLVFGQDNRLLDVFFGKHAGECFGDDPAFSLGRKDICTATLFQNGEAAGGVLFLMREIKGKKSLVILAIDPSVKVTTGLTSEKQGEIVDWMMGEAAKYARENGFGLYITDKAGGITQPGRLDEGITGKYFGKNTVTYENTGNFHRTYGYDINSAVDFVLPSKVVKIPLDKLYEIETKKFSDNPAAILGKDEFDGMFKGETVYSLARKGGKIVGFVVANPIDESLVGELGKKDIEAIKKGSTKEDFDRFASIGAAKTYYIDDIAILETTLGTRGMMKDFFNGLGEKGCEAVVYHGRMKNGNDELFDKTMEMNGYKKIHRHVEKEFFGGEDFMFTVFVKK